LTVSRQVGWWRGV